MVLAKKRKVVTDRKVNKSSIRFLANLILLLVAFNIGIMLYMNNLRKSILDPVLESKIISEMVLYHFGGSAILGGGLFLIACGGGED